MANERIMSRMRGPNPRHKAPWQNKKPFGKRGAPSNANGGPPRLPKARVVSKCKVSFYVANLLYLIWCHGALTDSQCVN